MPNLLGFSIGSFAILFSSFQGKIGPFMFQKDDGDEFSPAEELSATFMHFIIVQALALLIGIVRYSGLGSALTKVLIAFGYADLASMPLIIMHQSYKFIGFMLFIYSIMMLISSTAAIFRTITWEVMANNSDNK
jgi:hypothetical protein